MRYRLQEGCSLDQWLEQLEPRNTLNITDEYFDIADGGFYKKGIFIRLRNDNVLEIKFNPDHLTGMQATDHVQYREYRFPISKYMFNPQQSEEFSELENLIGIKRPAPFSFMQFLGCNHLRSLVTLSKTRKTYACSTAPRIRIAVDIFDGLGTFVEFEAQATTPAYPIDDVWKDVQRIVADLPLIPFHAGHIEFALRETNTALYK